MKKFLKFLAGFAAIASIIGGAYYVIKNFILKDEDDFDEFDDDFDDFDDFDTPDTSSDDRGYVTLNSDDDEADSDDNEATEEDEESDNDTAESAEEKDEITSDKDDDFLIEE